MKMTFIDLSHTFEEQMPGFRLKKEDGTYTQFTAKIHPFLTREQMKPMFKGDCSFEITEMSFQTSVGTYIDSPYHRYRDGRDVSEIRIDEVILPGVALDVRGHNALQGVNKNAIDDSLDFKGKAVLFNFGWDDYWGEEQYYSYPHLAKETIELLIERGAKLVGVYTINIDDARDLTRPAHSLLLRNDILIVENLTNLEQLHGKQFRFFAVPVKAKKVAAIPIRALAEIAG
jgi:kynurenine formamidase